MTVEGRAATESSTRNMTRPSANRSTPARVVADPQHRGSLARENTDGVLDGSCVVPVHRRDGLVEIKHVGVGMDDQGASKAG